MIKWAFDFILQTKENSTRQTLHAAVNTRKGANGELSIDSITDNLKMSIEKLKKLETLKWTLWKSKARGRIPTLPKVYHIKMKLSIEVRKNLHFSIKKEASTHYGVSRPVGNAIQNASSTNSIAKNGEKTRSFLKKYKFLFFFNVIK